MSAQTITVAAVLFLCAFRGTGAEAPVADEYEIKAAMLANVFKLVDWPTAKTGDAGAAFVFGIASSDEMAAAFGRSLSKMPGVRTLAGRPVVIRRITGVEGIGQCQAIFVGGSDRKRQQEIIQAAGMQPILTVGESDKFAASGGIVGLVVRDDRIQVEVNLSAAQSAGLSVSSRLLRIAVVRGSGAP